MQYRNVIEIIKCTYIVYICTVFVYNNFFVDDTEFLSQKFNVLKYGIQHVYL